MSGPPSTLGFGWQLYGDFPFGLSDWAEEVTWKIFSPCDRDADYVLNGVVPLPLRKWADVMKPLLEELRVKWFLFPSLWDADRCPISNLPQLAYTVGLVDDESLSEPLRRSRILNVAQLVINKGTDRGYEIVGGFNGLLVSITPLWAADCVSTAPADFQTTGPTTFYPTLRRFAADEVACDQTFPGFYDRWPRQLTWDNPCRTAWLDLYFFAPDDADIEDFQTVALRVTADLERFTPIHVRIRNLTFDGPRVAAGGWTLPTVIGGALVSAGGWTLSVTGGLMVAAGGWTIPVIATPAP